MPRTLLLRLRHDSIDEFNSAADERLRDAERLAEANRRTAAIYAFGYVVEMLLKVAFLRLVGFAGNAPISMTALRNFIGVDNNSLARSLGLSGTRNLHDITAWAELIFAYRSSNGLNYRDPQFADEIRAKVKSVHRLWSETLRYHSNVAYNFELEQVQFASRWIVENRAAL